ncbi:DUF6286 domain-containing protein [Actinomadura rubrisoli]|uniref:DUF6286 domain-containing protein n=1 Tax=Actinomadura rubrisoli TaxID=2530368 RepID=A0A4V2YQD6_9ACTN|nr:DUF6286 domain-containing protein [Actinomadura rubrisoli]TDD61647.1 hypothetical protein E1298_45235 [Actinomadura rubrisoli]
MTAHAGRLPHVRRASAAADRAAKHAFRSRRVWPGLIAALLVTAAGVLTAMEVITERAGRPAHIVPYERVRDWAEDTAWEDWPALAAAGGLTLLGLLFLLAGLLPGKSRVVPLHGEDPNLMVGVTRRGLKAAVAAAAGDAPGVSSVRRVRLRRRRVKVVARTPVRDAEGLDSQVEDAVRASLDRLQPLPARSVSVRVKHRET